MKLFICLSAAILLTPALNAVGQDWNQAPMAAYSGGEPVPQAVPAEFPQEAMPEGLPGSRPPEGQPPSGCRAQFIDSAKAYMGMPYVHGGKSKSQGGVDCSGLVVAAFTDLKSRAADDCPKDIALMDKLVNARSTDKMWPILPDELKIRHEDMRGKLKAGDLIFSDYGYAVPAGLPGHVFIFVEYVGDQVRVVESGGTGSRNVADEVRSLTSDATGASMSTILGD